MAEYNKAQLTEMIVGKLLRNFGRTVDEATPNHMFKACAMVLRDIMSGHQIETEQPRLGSPGPAGPLPLSGIPDGPLFGEERL